MLSVLHLYIILGEYGLIESRYKLNKETNIFLMTKPPFSIKLEPQETS